MQKAPPKSLRATHGQGSREWSMLAVSEREEILKGSGSGPEGSRSSWLFKEACGNGARGRDDGERGVVKEYSED